MTGQVPGGTRKLMRHRVALNHSCGDARQARPRAEPHVDAVDGVAVRGARNGDRPVDGDAVSSGRVIHARRAGKARSPSEVPPALPDTPIEPEWPHLRHVACDVSLDAPCVGTGGHLVGVEQRDGLWLGRAAGMVSVGLRSGRYCEAECCDCNCDYLAWHCLDVSVRAAVMVEISTAADPPTSETLDH